LRSSLDAVLKRTLILLAIALSLVLSACGGGQPETCEDISDVTIDLMQELIDNVEEEVGDMTVEELVATQGDLPSVEQFQEEATTINEQALELECSQATIESLVAERVDQLEATSPIGQFMIEAIRSGGL
jgi:hypothetical protein